MSMTFCHFFHINAAFSYKKNEKTTFLPHLAHRMPCRLRHCRNLYVPQPPLPASSHQTTATSACVPIFISTIGKIPHHYRKITFHTSCKCHTFAASKQKNKNINFKSPTSGMTVSHTGTQGKANKERRTKI